MRKFFIKAAAAASMLLGSLSMQATTLADLNGTSTCLVEGDKRFCDFTAVLTGPTGIALPTSLSHVTVTTDLIAGKPALIFNGGFLALGPGAGIDLAISYTASVIGPQLITSIGLSFDPFVTGTGVASITERIFTLSNTLVGFGAVAVVPAAGLDTRQVDITLASALGAVRVTKDIFAAAPRRGDFVNFSFVDQVYSQTGDVPEPGTMAMMGLGLLGAGIYRRRRLS